MLDIKLPDTIPAGVWWGFFALAAIVLTAFVLLEWGDQIIHIFNGQTRTVAVAKPPQVENDFPDGCTALSVVDVPGGPSAALRFRNHPVDDMLRCNPTVVLRAGKSSVVDIDEVKNFVKGGSLVTVRSHEGLAKVGVRADTAGGFIQLVRCSPFRYYEARWGTFVSATISLQEQTTFTNKQFDNLSSVCREGW